MKLTLFYVSYAFLLTSLVFHILGVSTNSWWGSGPSAERADEVVFVGGLWKICVAEQRLDVPCVDYTKLFDVELNGVNVHTAIGTVGWGPVIFNTE